MESHPSGHRFSSITDSARACECLFESVRDVASRVTKAHILDHDVALPNAEKIMVEQERFDMWVANTAAFGRGRGSLDYRLRELPEELDLMQTLLDNLHGTLDEYKTAADGAVELRQQRSASQEDEDGRDLTPVLGHSEARLGITSSHPDRLSEHQKDNSGASSAAGRSEAEATGRPRWFNYTMASNAIHSSIDWLHRLSVLVRKAGVVNQNLRARTFKMPGVDEEGLKSFFGWLVARVFPGLVEQLKSRMASTMLERHRRVLYRRARLKAGAHAWSDEPDSRLRKWPEPTRARLSQSRLAATAGTAPSMEGKAWPTNDLLAVSGPSLLSSGTLTEPSPSLYRAYAASNVSKARSVAVDWATEMILPPPPPTCRTSENFVCDFCCVILDSRIGKNDTQWRKHVLQDLDPFICLFDKCNVPHDIYSTKQEWLRHMRDEHLVIWRCSSTDHDDCLDFGTEEELAQHITQKHPGMYDDDLLPFALEAGRVSSTVVFESCPFCGQHPEAIEDHVGHHLLCLAASSLPWTEGVDEKGGEDDTNDDCRAPTDQTVARGTLLANSTMHGSIATGYQDDDILLPESDNPISFYGLGAHSSPGDRRLEWGFINGIDGLHEKWRQTMRLFYLQNQAAATELDSFHRPLYHLQSSLRNSDNDETKHTEIQDGLAVDVEGMSTAQMQRVQAWLQPTDSSVIHQSTFRRRFKGTCTWFLESSTFHEWKSQSCHHLLLLGLVGCGKTVLASTVLHYLYEQDPSVIILDFFFRFKQDDQNLNQLLSTLICQLYLRCDTSRAIVDATLQELESAYLGLSTSILSKMFSKMVLAVIDSHIFVIMDALDECHARDNMVSWLESVSDLPNVSFLATSRPEFRFELRPAGWKRVRIDSSTTESVKGDIQTYIDARLSEKDFQRKNLSRHMLDHIRTRITDRAGSMFVVATWQLEQLDLKSLTMDNIEATLKSFPADLDYVYSHMLQNILKGPYPDRTIRLLQFLCYSKRPLTLDEAIDAVAVDLDIGFDLNQRLLFKSGDLRESCACLVDKRTRESEGRQITELQLSHWSVQEYLTSSKAPGHFQGLFSLENAHGTIARTCLAYLSSIEFCDTNSETEERFPLVRYAANFWSDHARPAQGLEDVQHAIWEFINDQNNYTNWIRTANNNKPLYDSTGETPSRLYDAAFLGLETVVRVLIEKGADTNMSGGVYGSALQAASAKGHTEVVCLLIEKGADINASGGVYGSALQAASARGYTEVVRVLIEKGADPSASGGHHGSALQAASANGHTEVVRVLIEEGAAINGRGKSRSSALHTALRAGHEEIVELLLTAGAHVNSKDRQSDTSLPAASRAGIKR